MNNTQDNFENELHGLKEELEHFQQEKERVRKIIGNIGGVPTFNTRLFNIIFITVIIITLGISVIGGKEIRLLMIEITTVAVSIKILYMMHCQSRINHFQFWMQSSIEWRINEIMKLLRKLDKEN